MITVRYAADTNSPQNGKVCQRIEIGAASRTVAKGMKSELQFLQKIDLVEKKTYRFTVWLRALEPAMLNIAFCQAGSPFTTYQRKIVSMTTQWQPSSVTATAPKTQRGYMMVATDKENVTL